jgi:hypothetical protein
VGSLFLITTCCVTKTFRIKKTLVVSTARVPVEKALKGVMLQMCIDFFSYSENDFLVKEKMSFTTRPHGGFFKSSRWEEVKSMAESKSHKKAKSRAPGQTEVPISRGRRLDSATKKTATEVERNRQNLGKAAERLRDSGRPRRVLQVPHHLIPEAVDAMKEKGISGSVKNLSGTKRVSVPNKK